MKRFLLSLLFLLGGLSTGWSQLSIVNIEKLPLESRSDWDAPQFSPDGKRIYLTTAGYTGIWEYSLDDRSTRIVTEDRGAGYGFVLSPDAKRIAYRRTKTDKETHRRVQEIVVMDLSTGKSTVQASGRDLSLPTFSTAGVVFSGGKEAIDLPSVAKSGEVLLIGIENTKIALVRNGNKILLDPFGKGSYIWPTLSPDRQRIAAYEMSRGTFVCDLDGTVRSELGKKDAAVWTRDGKWLVYMDDKDDGHRILSSELYCTSPDGGTVVQLTDTENVVELYPQCSPTENKIVCSSLRGGIYLLTYKEVGQ
jgi:Tol biopolymer transport system component